MEVPKFEIHRKLDNELKCNLSDEQIKKLLEKYKKEKLNGTLKFAIKTEKINNSKNIDFTVNSEESFIKYEPFENDDTPELKTAIKNFENRCLSLCKSILFGKITLTYTNGLLIKIESSDTKNGYDLTTFAENI